MTRNGLYTISDYLPTFESAPRGYIGRHRKCSHVARVVSARTVMAYTVTLSMTAGLMTLILLGTHAMGV